MKKIALFFTAVFLIGTSVIAKTTNLVKDNSFRPSHNSDYGNSFIFNEGGIEFSIFPDGQFDFYALNYGPKNNVSINTPNVSFSFNTGYDYSPYVQYDDYGAIVQIENIGIYYDYYGRIVQAGNVSIHYNSYGRVNRVGSLHVYYDNHHRFSHYSGYINGYNRSYVYRPWHRYYTIPVYEYRVVYAKPYRRYYTPVRHTYYRPYANNYREPVRYEPRYENSYSSGRRSTVASTNNRISDRYRQDVSSRRTSVNSRSVANTTRQASAKRNNESSRVDRGTSRTVNKNISGKNLDRGISQRTSQGTERTRSNSNSNTSNISERTGSIQKAGDRNISGRAPQQATRSTSPMRNQVAKSSSSRAPQTASMNKKMIERKPNASPSRTYNTESANRNMSTTQKSRRTTSQANRGASPSRSTHGRGN